jgi:hypothetical protein
MSSRSALARRDERPDDRVIAPVAAKSIDQDAPANDDGPESEFSFNSDPLFGMAIASIILLMVFAALISSS